MPAHAQSAAVRSIEILFRSGTSCGLTDAELLERFIANDKAIDRSSAAFESLVLRHGPLVLDVCRHVLGNSHEAEDAFQATFLILATKAASVRHRSSVASWLHGVALRTASRLKVEAARRRIKEQQAAESRVKRVDPEKPQHDFSVLHEEVGRLPRKYRDPIILCYFEGMTQEMAAQQLRCPAGTIGVRLMRAKARLKHRLDRRGEAFAPALLITSVPGTLFRSTAHASIQFTESGPISLAVAQLAKEVSRAMFIMKLRGVAAIALVAATVLSGVGMLTRFAAADAPPQKAKAVEKDVPSKPVKPKKDLEELQGTWLTRAELRYSLGNVPQPVERVMEKWVIDGEVIRTFPQPTERQPEILNENTYLLKIDESRTAKQIDLVMPGLGSLKGIYELDGDSLRICCGLQNRPAAFLHDPKNDSTLFTLKRLRRTPEKITPRFANSLGCFWVVYPSQPGGVVTTTALTMMSDYEADQLTIHIAYPSEKFDSELYRPVAFDTDRNRFYPRYAQGGGVGGTGIKGKDLIVLRKYRLNKEDFHGKKIQSVGVELVTPQALDLRR